jgi:DNA modification methylase
MSLQAVLRGEQSYHIETGDAREVLRRLPEASVHCVVTSPPYWGLRDYGVAGQIGLEDTPEAWATGLVEVFREVRRVLRADGTMWVNVGDLFVANSPGGVGQSSTLTNPQRQEHLWRGRKKTRPPGLKRKDLVGLPWLLAFALRADGWYLRQEVIWHKRNPTPENVHDRPTRDHEQIFLFSRSARYFYDGFAIRDRTTGGAHTRGRRGYGPKAAEAPSEGRPRQNASFLGSTRELVATRNARSVWTGVSEPFGEAHFATYPSWVPERCLLAGTSAGGACASCGAPRVRVVGPRVRVVGRGNGNKAPKANHQPGRNHRMIGFPWQPGGRTHQGWAPSCGCEAGGGTRPCIVLDPFSGAATTGLAALRNGRAYLGAELSPEYVAQSERRLGAWRGQQRLDAVGLARWGVAE